MSKELSWKPVEIDGALFNNLNADGLMGIEECLDYDLNTVVTKEKNKKRKVQPFDGKNEQAQNKRNKKLRTNASDNHLQPPVHKSHNNVNNKLLPTKSKATQLITKKKNMNKKLLNSKSSVKVEKAVVGTFSPSKEGATDFNISAATGEMPDDIRDESAFKITEPDEMHAWNSFGLPKPLLSAIEELDFKEPTPIQALTLPSAILGRRDILGAAETGSGKTLAFGLPILTGILKQKELQANKVNDLGGDDEDDLESESEEELSDNLEGTGCVKVLDNIELDKPVQRKPLYALILTPTRELAVQVKNHLVAAAKYTGIQVAVIVGGMAMVKQERVLSKGPEIVVATPGRLWELIQEGNIHLSQVDDIRFLAIDETDRMIERGHFKELQELLERINADENKRKLRQNFVFSATLTLVHELPRYLAVKKKIRNSKKISKLTSQQKLQQIIEMLGITNPKIVDVTQASGTAGTLAECRITCNMEEKDFYVYYFLQRHPGRTLIFCNSIGCVKRLTTLLGLLGCNPLALHASMQQRQRLKNLDRFRDNEKAILIATDVAARGLDIPCVEHVLHYQTPRTSEGYVHRSGRTARASRQGITVLLVEPSELSSYLRMCRTLGRTQDLPLFPIEETMLNSIKQRVKLAREVDKLDLQVKKANSESGWIQKAAEEMDILIDDNVSRKYDSKETRGAKKAAEVKRKHLVDLLRKPLLPLGFSGKYPLISAEVGFPFQTMETKSESAVDVLKTSMENYGKAFRNKAKWLFKPKSWDTEQKTDVKLPEVKNKKKKKNNKNKKRVENIRDTNVSK